MKRCDPYGAGRGGEPPPPRGAGRPSLEKGISLVWGDRVVDVVGSPKKRITQSRFTHFFVYYKILFMFLKFFGPISNLVSCFGSEVFSQRVPITWRNRGEQRRRLFHGSWVGPEQLSVITRVIEACNRGRFDGVKSLVLVLGLFVITTCGSWWWWCWFFWWNLPP